MGCCGGGEEKPAGGGGGGGGGKKGAAWKARAPKSVPQAKRAEFGKAQGETQKAVWEALKGLTEAPEKVPDVIKSYGDLGEKPFEIPAKMQEMLSDPLALFNKIGVPKECLVELAPGEGEGKHFVEKLACGCVQAARGSKIEGGMDKMIACWKKDAKDTQVSEALGKEIFRELVYTYVRSVMEVLIDFVAKMTKKGCDAIAAETLDKLYEEIKDKIQPLIDDAHGALPDDVKECVKVEDMLDRCLKNHRKQFIASGDKVAKDLTGKAVKACEILEGGIAADCFEPWWKKATGGKATASFADLKKHMHGFEQGLLKQMRERVKTEELSQKLKSEKYLDTIEGIPMCVGESLVDPTCFVNQEFIIEEGKKAAAELVKKKASEGMGAALGGVPGF